MSDIKFVNIKEGDTVYVLKEITYGWRNAESFFIPVKVGKVTPKSFYIGEELFRKDGGVQVGGRNCRAYKEGEIYYNRVVKDETYEARAFEYKLHAVRKISELSSKITVPMVRNIDPNTLKSVVQTLAGIVEGGESNDIK